MKLLTFIFLAFALNANSSISIYHHNILELDSAKIKNNNSQIIAVKELLKKQSPDIISINEIQYDLPGVPTSHYQSTGENMNYLADLLSLDLSIYNSSFHPANTGLNAKKMSNGEYPINGKVPGARDLADQINFGVFPAQYSTGALLKYNIIESKQFSKLAWNKFNPRRDLSAFAMSNGNPFPKSMELFDKNFTDTTFMYKGKIVHLITLHTVPAYHFGNPRSPNYARNADQLRFLEWYLTGKTDISVGNTNITPLSPNDIVIAVGDWNTDVNDLNKEGSVVLKRILSKFNSVFDTKTGKTHGTFGYAPPRSELLLDYLIYSKHFKKLSGEVLAPSKYRVDLGCSLNAIPKPPRGHKAASYTKNNELCYVILKDQDYWLKSASDHYPIRAELEL